MTNLLGEPPETLLPADPGEADLEQGMAPAEVAQRHPDSVAAWAMMADEALDAARDLEGYAFARTAYHRSLDGLRRNGWRGHGPVPWSHVPNRGFLQSLAVLATASERLGDDAEAHRCREFLRESSREGYEAYVD